MAPEEPVTLDQKLLERETAGRKDSKAERHGEGHVRLLGFLSTWEPGPASLISWAKPLAKHPASASSNLTRNC
jgi:hypothetical protein